VYRKAVDIERYKILQQYKQSQMRNPEEDLRVSILNEAHIVFTTLTGSGTNVFGKLKRGFDVIIIGNALYIIEIYGSDEAAQAVELSTMVPFMRNSPYKCIMVGDPKQLPATVISENSKQYLFTQSLFERFQRSGCRVFLLSVQYRMNPGFPLFQEVAKKIRDQKIS
jgi:senataxin